MKVKGFGHYSPKGDLQKGQHKPTAGSPLALQRELRDREDWYPILCRKRSSPRVSLFKGAPFPIQQKVPKGRISLAKIGK